MVYWRAAATDRSESSALRPDCESDAWRMICQQAAAISMRACSTLICGIRAAGPQSAVMRFCISSSGTPLVSGITFKTHINCSTIMLE